MKRDHLSLAAGFLPGISLLIFLVCRRYMQSGQSLPDWAGDISAGWLWVLVEMIAFLLPLLILIFLCGRKKETAVDFCLRKFPVGAVPMLLTLAVTMALADLLLGDAVAGFGGKAYAEVYAFAFLLESSSSVWALLLAVVLIPTLGGQLLFGRGLMTIYASSGGVPAAITCAFAYALLMGTPETLICTFLCMLVFIYVSWATNSIWIGVLIQGTYHVVHLLLFFVARAYSGQDLWNVVRLVMIFLFGLFLYLSMHSMEQLMEKGLLRRMERFRRETLLNKIVFSPGLWMTLFLFVINWIT